MPIDSVRGKTAVVTGGGSGIGRALVLAFADEGANVVVSDIEAGPAEAVAEEARQRGVQAAAVRTDVSDAVQVEALADAAFAEFGSVDVLCNNAGVLILSPMLDSIPQDWDWLFGVNVMGVVHGIHAFVPRMRAQGTPAHIVNTGSVSGLGGNGVYGASKAAVLAISETLHEELAPHGIGVTCVMPANINSRILGAQRNRPDAFGRHADEPFGTDLTSFGIEPEHVARRVVKAVLADELYVLTFPAGWERKLKPQAEQRFQAILDAIDHGIVG